MEHLQENEIDFVSGGSAWMAAAAPSGVVAAAVAVVTSETNKQSDPKED